MKTPHVSFPARQENEVIRLLIAIGTRKNVAQVLVYLADGSEAASRDIEQGTGLRQPEVSLALQYLIGQDWIRITKSSARGKGRPVKIYSLSKPVGTIINSIGKAKNEQANRQIARVQKIREYIA